MEVEASVSTDGLNYIRLIYLCATNGYNWHVHHEALTHLFFCLFGFSPGRSPISFDHEIVMMNHVYKERFPKVCTAHSHFLLFSLIC